MPDGRTATVLGQHIATIAVALLYLLSMFGWGSLLLIPFKTQNSLFDDVISRLVAGAGLLYALFVGLSVFGLLHSLEVGIALGCGVLVSIFFLPVVSRHSIDWTQWQKTDLVLLGGIALLAMLQVVFALTPLVFYDLQVYHLLAPAQFLNAGSLVHIPWSVLTNSPLALQLTVGMSLALDSSGQLAKLLFAILGLLLPLGVFELLRPVSRRAALVAVLFVLCFPEFWLMQTLGVVDVPIAGLVVFGGFWLRKALRDGTWCDVALSGIAFGFAIGSRYQALVLTGWIAVALVAEHFIVHRRALPDRKTILRLALLMTVMAVMISPWMVRNYAHMGNPVYPFMQSVWGASEWSQTQALQLRSEALGPGLLDVHMMGRVLAPFAALLMVPANGLFGTALLLGALIALFQRRRELRLIAILGLGGLLSWSFIHPTLAVPLLRFNAASIALLLAVTGAVLTEGDFVAKAGPRVAAVLAVGSFVIAMVHVSSLIPVPQALANSESRQQLQQSTVPSWAAIQYVNQKLNPKQDRVLVIGETRGFWIHVPFIAPSCFNGPQLDSIFSADPGRWNESLARLGITHLIISNSELQRLHKQYGYLGLMKDSVDVFNEWAGHLPLLFKDERGTVVLAVNNSTNSVARSN